MATRRGMLLMNLPKDAAEKAIKYCKDYVGDRWLDDQPRPTQSVGDIISEGFIWQITPEGQHFWEEIYKDFKYIR